MHPPLSNQVCHRRGIFSSFEQVQVFTHENILRQQLIRNLVLIQYIVVDASTRETCSEKKAKESIKHETSISLVPTLNPNLSLPPQWRQKTNLPSSKSTHRLPYWQRGDVGESSRWAREASGEWRRDRGLKEQAGCGCEDAWNHCVYCLSVEGEELDCISHRQDRALVGSSMCLFACWRNLVFPLRSCWKLPCLAEWGSIKVRIAAVSSMLVSKGQASLSNWREMYSIQEAIIQENIVELWSIAYDYSVADMILTSIQ